MLRAKMYGFATVDLIGGFIPFFGDIFDAIYKANTRNAWLLEDYLLKKAQEQHGQVDANSDDIELGLAGPPPGQPQKVHKNGR